MSFSLSDKAQSINEELEQLAGDFGRVTQDTSGEQAAMRIMQSQVQRCGALPSAACARVELCARYVLCWQLCSVPAAAFRGAGTSVETCRARRSRLL